MTYTYGMTWPKLKDDSSIKRRLLLTGRISHCFQKTLVMQNFHGGKRFQKGMNGIKKMLSAWQTPIRLVI